MPTGGAHGDSGTAESGGSGAADSGTAPSSRGGTITFREIGAAGWYPSRRDPASGACDAVDTATCCMARHELTSDALTPWDDELIMTLRGPMQLSQLAVYQPSNDGEPDWVRAAAWQTSSSHGISFDGEATAEAAFAGVVGNQCLVDVASDREFVCGEGSAPYCPAGNEPKHYGWSGSKLIVLLASMPHASDGRIAPGLHCGDDPADNWYDAPWIGFSVGELVRSGKFGDCHCYAKDPAEWWLGDGCGQLNAFEVVNDNNAFTNLEVFSSNFFGYQGYIGEGPCGSACDLSALDADVDLIDKRTSAAAPRGAVAMLGSGPGAAFVRPSTEPRYFVVLFDIASRTVQLAMISPASIPAAAGGLLPELPPRIAAADVATLLALRLPD